MSSGFKKAFVKWFPFRQRKERVHTIHDLVDLLDRFLYSKHDTGWEWDDFISWRHDNDFIEKVRDRIAGLEPLFFSEDREDNEKAISIVKGERNRLAALIGLDARD